MLVFYRSVANRVYDNLAQKTVLLQRWQQMGDSGNADIGAKVSFPRWSVLHPGETDVGGYPLSSAVPHPAPWAEGRTKNIIIKNKMIELAKLRKMLMPSVATH